MSVLALATGSATRLLKSDQEVLRKLRHGDAEPVKPRIAVKVGGRQKAITMPKPTSVVPPETNPVQVRLRLYVSGNAPNSVRAIANAKAICASALRVAV